METEQGGPGGYINDPTRQLVGEVSAMIEGRRSWRISPALHEAFGAFDAVCRIEPAIVPFMRAAASDPRGSLSLPQIQLIMLATLARSSSSYGTIPELVVLLNLAADYEFASKVNDNAVHEAGTSKLTSHPRLLLDSFAILAESIRSERGRSGPPIVFPALTQASFALVRQIHLMREAIGDPSYGDAAGIGDYVAANQIYCPPFSEQDIETALHYCSLCEGGVTAYHTGVLRRILGLSDRGREPDLRGARRDPTDRGWLAAQAFEFCTREASSADVGSDISYVGAYGLFTKAFLGYVPGPKRELATKWCWVHSDADVGKSLGWGDTAELGHAADARELVARVFEGLNAENAASAIEAATSMSRLRLDYWRLVVDRLVALGGDEGAVRIPFQFEEYQPSVRRHAEAIRTFIRFDRANDALVIEPEGSEPLSIRPGSREFASLARVSGLTPEVMRRLRRGEARGELSVRFVLDGEEMGGPR